VIVRSRRILGAAAVPLDGWVRLAGGAIVEVGEGAAPGGDTLLDHEPAWLAPGFVDLHVHGGAGATFQSGDPDEAATVAAYHRAHGTTTMVASLVTAAVPELVTTTRALSELVEDGLLAGVHLEGPFLSHARCGAHEPTLLADPTPDLLEPLLAAGRVAMITLAPELPGGIEAIRRSVGQGVVVAVGHTDATYQVVVDAVAAGARVATHLFNGMRPLHHREPGPVLALVEDERVVVELINDGVHLHPALVRAVMQQVGADRVALVTDAMSAAGLGDGDYVLGRLAVEVAGGVPRLKGSGSIAGSTLTMGDSVRNAVRAGVDPQLAVAAATETPAGVLGLERSVGRIAPGFRADLVALDDDFRVSDVVRGGEVVAP
jgi:N-acetylglucosamine-6-phosphate deacetylase